MQRPIGRPSKGRRPMSRLTVPAIHAPAVEVLRSEHGRSRADTIAALTVIGLRHLDELARASLCWASERVPLPADYEQPNPDAEHPLFRTAIRLPELHHKAIEHIVDLYSIGASLRSALVWIGLNHVDEILDAHSELDSYARRLPDGDTVGDFYADTVNAFYAGTDTATAPTVVLKAIRQLHAGATVADVNLDTGVPPTLLAALSAEAIAVVEGSLPLTG